VTEIEALAHVLEGEASVCGFMGMLAVSWAYSRNKAMYGWQTPSPLAEFVAQWWWAFEDPTHGSMFLFSKQDMADERVQAIVKDRGPPKLAVDCKAGLALYAY